MLMYLLSTPKILHNYWIYTKLSKIKFNTSWLKVSFAGTMKKMLSILLNVPVEMFEDRDFKENVFVDFNNLKLYRREDIKKSRIMSDSKFSRHVKELTVDLYSYVLSIRQLLQYWGTEINRRYLGDSLWCLSTLKAAETSDLIISDLRFKTEADFVNKLGGKVIYIDRPGCVASNHISEKEAVQLKNEGRCDYTIHNDGTLEDLFYKCKDLLAEIKNYV